MEIDTFRSGLIDDMLPILKSSFAIQNVDFF